MLLFLKNLTVFTPIKARKTPSLQLGAEFTLDNNFPISISYIRDNKDINLTGKINYMSNDLMFEQSLRDLCEFLIDKTSKVYNQGQSEEKTVVYPIAYLPGYIFKANTRLAIELAVNEFKSFGKSRDSLVAECMQSNRNFIKNQVDSKHFNNLSLPQASIL